MRLSKKASKGNPPPPEKALQITQKQRKSSSKPKTTNFS